MAVGADRKISFIGVGLNTYLFLSCIHLLFHNLYSTKPVKRVNLDGGHHLSPGQVFGDETSYPVKIAECIIYTCPLKTDLEKNYP
jgi:hypothetical protein